MTDQEKNTRANSIRQRRSSQTRSKMVSNNQVSKTPARTGTSGGRQTVTRRSSQTARQNYHPDPVLLPGKSRQGSRTTLRRVKGSFSASPASGRASKGRSTGRMTGNSQQKGYDFAFSFGRTAVHAPTLSLPILGTRWVSAGLTLIMVILLYAMATANTFKVTTADVRGNQRLEAADVSSMLGVIGQPIYKAIPSQIEQDLRTAFPELSSVSVEVSLPNHIKVSLVERTPALAWYQDDKITWIDQNGVAFTPRGDIAGLVQIAANGNPPKLPVDQDLSIFDQSFLTSSMVQAIITLYPQVPEGSPMVYDPKYGLGWQDPHGWSVYFGQDTQDISMKKNIYQAIVDKINQQGIQPTLVSVAYLDAPFYK
jgi:hypothetical protein